MFFMAKQRRPFGLWQRGGDARTHATQRAGCDPPLNRALFGG
jgi:hypothetical protein